MRVLFINAVCGIGSTGKICVDLAQKYENEGNIVKIAYGRTAYVPEKYKKYAVRIGNDFDVKLHALQTRMFDNHGFASKRATKKFLKWADEYKPELLWLHNLHGYYINIELLFKWIKNHPDMQVKWTLHDCWAFTGHCAYFTGVGCEKWKIHCYKCEQKKQYPATLFFDRSYKNYETKKNLFTGVKNLEIITPSNWLANLVKQSFLKDYPVKVVYNKIDTNIFKPTASDFRKRYGLENKIIILGVANVWDKRKGLEDFIELSKKLDNNYKIVLVGLNTKQIKNLPANILGLEKTLNLKRLAEIYSAADIYINLSKEETFGMTTIEALNCGTKVIVYKGTACEEVIGKNGVAVEHNINALRNAIVKLI